MRNSSIRRLSIPALAGMTLFVGGGDRLPAVDEPFPAHRIIGNVYYVGTKELASFLITTNDGLILINSGFESTVPMIRASVEKLGFKYGDIKLLLNSHAHGDHVGGNALVKRETGAKTMIMVGDDKAVRTGGEGVARPGQEYPPSKIDHLLKDREQVRHGEMTLTAYHTPGHTPGTTSWAFKVTDGGRSYDVVVIGGGGPEPDTKLVGNTQYPNIVADYQKTFAALTDLPCDVQLGPHGNYFSLEQKYAQLVADSTKNPYIDPERLRRAVPMLKKRFDDQLAKQSAEAKSGS